MDILVLNSGSSSLKFQLIDTGKEEVLAKGTCERIGLDKGSIVFESIKIEGKYTIEKNMADHEEAMDIVFALLQDDEKGAISDIAEIGVVGHRVVHGGEKYSESILVDDSVIRDIEKLSALAPLHNPANLMGIKACLKIMPDVPQVAVFDTAFHQTMPKKAYMYALPYEYYQNNGVRRYGFHGTSHKFVAQKAIEFLLCKGIKAEDSKIITLHLGNGSSMAAISGGKVIDTTMGLTPVEGLVMGTRCGDVDPAVLPFIAKEYDMSFDDIGSMINKKSGLLGLSGTSSDMREIVEGIESGDERCRMTMDVFAYRIQKYIGSYTAAMGGLDTIVFTGGIGENSGAARTKICENMSYFGINLDPAAFDARGSIVDLSIERNGKILLIPTNEELMIAREAAKFI